MNHILYLIFKIILKNLDEKAINPSIRIYINKIENIITFKIETGYYPKRLTLESMKLLGTTKITKDKMVEMCLI